MTASLALLSLAVTWSAAAPVFEPAPVGPIQRHNWQASWIAHEHAPARGAAVMHVRKFLELGERPNKFLVHVSADNRYVLYVNGTRVGAGPARGDLEHWRYATLDLGPHLHAGRNLIAATVWNFGGFAPISQMSHRTAFVMQGDDGSSAAANTDTTWEAAIEAGHAFTNAGVDNVRARFFYAAGPAERRDARTWDWNWNQPSSPKQLWSPAVAVNVNASPRSVRDVLSARLSPPVPMLVPDALPQMEEIPVGAGQVVRTQGPVKVEGDFSREGRLHFPPNSTAQVLLDRKVLTNAYPRIIVNGGRGARMRVHYSESLWTKDGQKGNRDEIEGKEFFGLHDEFVPDGQRREFETLWWRSWRYLLLDVETANDALVVEGASALQTLYPFANKAKFDSDDPELGKIWNTAFWTLRISAWETYMDSPYWEQLQYVGDTRITALLSYVMANDDRLARQAILAFDESRTSDGLTMSRYPSNIAQYIPPYSLFWVGMVHDFYHYRDDVSFVRDRLPGTRTVLDWFLRRQRPDGLLHFIRFWSHVDPVEREARQTDEGGSGAQTTQFIEALREGADLEDAVGDRSRARLYRQAADRAVRGMQQLWDPKQGLYRDQPGGTEFSHDVNLMSLWLDVASGERRKQLAKRVLEIGRMPPGRRSQKGSIEPASLYFRYYLHRALDHAGMGDEFLSLIDAWRQMLNIGLSTFPEHADPTRSDSHAWTAHPALDLLAIVGGIRPAAPGFKRVLIKPHLGKLTRMSATVPHPAGDITVDYRIEEGKLAATITLPAGIPGEFVWAGRHVQLKGGTTSKLTLPLRL